MVLKLVFDNGILGFLYLVWDCMMIIYFCICIKVLIYDDSIIVLFWINRSDVVLFIFNLKGYYYYFKIKFDMFYDF